MTLEQFIREVIIGQTTKVAENHPYHAFITISLGIELLGNLQDTDDLRKKKISGKRLKAGVAALSTIDSRYNSIEGIIKNDLRHSFAHTLSVGSKIKLTTSKELSASDYHLRKIDGTGKNAKTLIVIENFIKDFDSAFENICQFQPRYIKLDEQILEIDIKSNGRYSGGTESHLTI